MQIIERTEFMPGFCPGLSINTWKLKLFVPQDADGLVILAATRADREGVARGLAEALNQAGLAVAIPGPNFEDWMGDEDASQNVPLFRKLANLGSWAREQTGGGRLPLGIFGVGDAAAAAAGAAVLLKRELDALVICTPGPDIAELALQGVSAPTLFLADGEDSLDLEFEEALSLTLLSETRVSAITRRQPPLENTTSWFLRHFAKSPLHRSRHDILAA